MAYDKKWKLIAVLTENSWCIAGPLRAKLIAIADEDTDLDKFSEAIEKQYQAWARWDGLRNDSSQSSAKQRFIQNF
eukprot:2541423-Alexandrium_andersonii.AAC.1